LQGSLEPDVRIRIDYGQSIEAIFHDAVELMCMDVLFVAPARVGKSLEQIDFTRSAEDVFLEAFLLSNSEAEAVVGLPVITALVELRTGMGLDTQRSYSAWIRTSDFNGIQYEWKYVIEYYTNERLPGFYSRESIGPDHEEAYEWNDVLKSLISDLWYRYDELAFLIKCFPRDVRRPQGSWHHVRVDCHNIGYD
jgi:hypothetical protein